MTPAFWLLLFIDALIIGWLYRQVKREEPGDNERPDWRIRKGFIVEPLPKVPQRIMRVPTIPADEDDNSFQQRARKAESLGFIDPNDKDVA